jgi:hypothetical protein
MLRGPKNSKIEFVAPKEAINYVVYTELKLRQRLEEILFTWNYRNSSELHYRL